MCCEAWLERRLRDFSVEKDERLGLKKGFAVLCIAIGLASVYGGFNATGSSSGVGSLPLTVVMFGRTVLYIAVGFALFYTRRLDPSLVTTWAIAAGVMVLLQDYFSLGVTDSWTQMVLIMDGILVFGAHRWAAQVVLLLTVVWITAVTAQSAGDYGLWRGAVDTARYDPFVCPTKEASLAFSILTSRLAVFVGDFYVTRKFAHSLSEQNEKLKASQQVTAELVVLLSAYAVDEAQEVAESSKRLPSELRAAYLQLIQYLRTYKAFLPQSCVPQLDEQSQQESQAWNVDSVLSVSDADARRSLGDVTTTPMQGASVCWTDSSSAPRGSGGDSSTDTPRSHKSYSGNNTSPADTVRPSAAQGAVRAVPKTQRVTCVSVNRLGLLALLAERGPAAVSELLNGEADRFARLCTQYKGVVELLSGDHFRASLNAARPCGTHRSAAVQLASAFTAPQGGTCGPLDEHHRPVLFSGAVCSGQVLCGDVGSTTIARFMIIGSMFNLLTVMERVAADWGARVLIDSVTHSDVVDTWRCRLRAAASFHKLGLQDIRLWDVDGERVACAHDDQLEWMYELDALADDPWAAHARAVDQWLAGQIGAAKKATADVLQAEVEPAVAAALRQMAADLDAGVPPPLFALTEACALPPGARTDLRSTLSGVARPRRRSRVASPRRAGSGAQHPGAPQAFRPRPAGDMARGTPDQPSALTSL